MKSSKILKIILSLFFNILFFVLPFLIVILANYNLVNCQIFKIDICSNLLHYFGFEKTLLFLMLGVLITLFSLLSNIFENMLSRIFSITASIFILVFMVLILNFGKIELEMENFYGVDKIKIVVNYEIIFFLLIFAIIVDILRKILIFFMK